MYMARAKKLAPFLLVVFSVIAGIFIIGLRATDKTAVSESGRETAPQGGGQTSANRTEPVPPQNRKKDPSPHIAALTEAIGGAQTADDANLTTVIAQEIVQKIISKNPPGSLKKNGGGIAAVAPDALIEEVVAKRLSEFDPAQFTENISPSSLVVTAVNDDTAVAAYVAGLNAALKKHYARLPVGVIASGLAAEKFAAITATLDTVISDLYSLPVPPRAASFHAKQIGLFTAQKNIFAAIADMQNDPFKALLAVQALKGAQETMRALREELLFLVK